MHAVHREGMNSAVAARKWFRNCSISVSGDNADWWYLLDLEELSEFNLSPPAMSPVTCGENCLIRNVKFLGQKTAYGFAGWCCSTRVDEGQKLL